MTDLDARDVERVENIEPSDQGFRSEKVVFVDDKAF